MKRKKKERRIENVFLIIKYQLKLLHYYAGLQAGKTRATLYLNVSSTLSHN